MESGVIIFVAVIAGVVAPAAFVAARFLGPEFAQKSSKPVVRVVAVVGESVWADPRHQAPVMKACPRE